MNPTAPQNTVDRSSAALLTTLAPQLQAVHYCARQGSGTAGATQMKVFTPFERSTCALTLGTPPSSQVRAASDLLMISDIPECFKLADRFYALHLHRRPTRAREWLHEGAAQAGVTLCRRVAVRSIFVPLRSYACCSSAPARTSATCLWIDGHHHPTNELLLCMLAQGISSADHFSGHIQSAGDCDGRPNAVITICFCKKWCHSRAGATSYECVTHVRSGAVRVMVEQGCFWADRCLLHYTGTAATNMPDTGGLQHTD
eukprot:9168-Heterococcus_DN1.PRE.2